MRVEVPWLSSISRPLARTAVRDSRRSSAATSSPRRTEPTADRATDSRARQPGGEAVWIMAEAGSVSLVVSLQVKEDRVDDFLEAMKVDAEGSRTEPGCLRFDVRPPPPAPRPGWHRGLQTGACLADRRLPGR